MQILPACSTKTSSIRARVFRRRSTLALLVWLPLDGGFCQAQTLVEALQAARDRSEQVETAEAEHEADEAGIVISRANGLPSVVTSVELNENLVGASNGTGRISVQGQANVPLYQGGGVKNAVRAAQARSDASQVAKSSAEAELFTAVVTNYANVIRDRQIVELSQANLQTLAKTLSATRARYQVRDLTKTDLAQAESRAALARGELESANARLSASTEDFQRLTGLVPVSLADLPEFEDLPATADQAATTAIEENPRVLAARMIVESRRYDILAARAEGLPTVSAVVTGRHSDGRSLAFGQTASRFGATVGLTLKWSMFQGGRTSARVTQTSARETQAQLALRDIERSLVARARSDFSNWKAAVAVVEASEQAVRAARQALSGVRAESDVGSRTILDILNAEQELRNAQVQLATAKRDTYLAAFSLLTTMGQTQSAKLSFSNRQAYAAVESSPAPVDRAAVAERRDRPANVPMRYKSSGEDDRAENSNVIDRELPPISALDQPLLAEVGSQRSRESGQKSENTPSIVQKEWVIQLAALGSVSSARENWAKIKASVMANIVVSNVLVSSVNGSSKKIFRLAVGAFSDFSGAETACHDLREQGLQCIVRRSASLGQIEWAETENNRRSDTGK